MKPHPVADACVMTQKNKIKYLRLHELAQELSSFVHNIQGLYLDSVIGFKLINKYIEKDQSMLKEFVASEPELATDEFQDSLSFQHSDIYGDDFSASAIHFAKKGEVKKRNKSNGENSKLVANLCIVMLYSFWEHYFRSEVAKAYGLEEINDDFWGDMRFLRHDILHCKSRCEKSNKAKILRWFKKGEKITITQDMMRDIFVNALKRRNQLMYDSHEKIFFKIPKSNVKS